MNNKKALGAVIATSLLIVVAVFTMVLFNNWFQTYSSNLMADVETQSSINAIPEIEKVIGDFVYIKTPSNMTIERLLVDGDECLTNVSLGYGMEKVDISSCLIFLSTKTPKITLISDNNIVMQSVYLKDVIISLDSNCYNPANIGKLGVSGICEEMLIVDRDMLLNAVANNPINAGEDFFIEYDGINYTFGDSAYNVFTGQVIYMDSLFSGETNFNANINYWNTSSVESMVSMFQGASSFDQPLNNWDVSQVTNMYNMFSGASSFNRPLNNWDVSNVMTMWWMFYYASSFNQDLTNWCVFRINSEPTNFAASSPLLNINKPNWGAACEYKKDFSYVTNSNFNYDIDGRLICSNANPNDFTNISGIYYYAVSNENIKQFATEKAYINYSNEIIYFNSSTICTSHVTNMENLFNYDSSFNGYLNSWDVSSVNNMYAMFRSAISFDQPLNNWDVSSVTSMSSMFQDATSFDQDLSSWNVSSVNNMYVMFYGASSFTHPLNNWNTSLVTNMRYMFYGASSFNQNISSWDVSLVTDMRNMFQGATIFNQNISSWCVSQIETKPTDFDTSSGFVGLDAIQPQWNQTCS